ncbi:MAG: ATP-dependent helicase [Chitinophagaceae bacterium]|nr:MAG: ATP-dependent helicase [Chitinophagaceae bacterium]
MNNIRQQLKDNFTREINRLNPEQKKAVNQTEGPVLVIAGPGTGKTQILAARIGNLLQQTDINPGNILCLTYTDNGRVEMRNRLFQFVGATAYRIPIHTFHSFCNEVIQDHLSYFGKLNLEAISELEEIELYKKLVDSIENGSPLKRFTGDVYFEIPRLKDLFAIMKKEAWTPEFLNERIDKYLIELPTREEYIYKRKTKDHQAGDIKTKNMQEETDRMETLRAAVNLFPRYRKMMQDAARYTFDDMILWVLDAFKNNQDILLDYQERYQYFLVDEFQDTSGSQNLLLQYLTSYWEPANVFVVGDDDQSVFSFQDANVENIRHFVKRFEKDLSKIVLVENYRSTQAILDIAKVLIEKNTERIINDDPSLNKNLISSNEAVGNIITKPEIIEYPNPVQEAVCVAEKIVRLLESGTSAKEIAVIYRNHKQADLLADWLGKKNIPLNMKRNINLLGMPFVKNILHILEYIAAENDTPYSGDELLFEILHYDFFQILPIDIAKISVSVAQNNYDSKKEHYSIRRAISEQISKTIPDLFSQEEMNEIKSASDLLEELIKKMNSLTVQGLLEEVIRQAGVLSYVMKSPDKVWLLQALNSLFDFIKSETKKRSEATLQQILDTIELMNKNDIAIPLQKITGTEDGVTLVTAHSSKGSEFEHVFLMGCNENLWDKKNTRGNRQYKLPDNLFGSAGQTDPLEESRRLFYVAITRAKTNLEISYASYDEAGKDIVRSTFVSEMMDGAGMEAIKEQSDEKQMADYLALQFSAPAEPEIELIDKNYIDQLLKRYSLSVTHLNNYLNCPIRFYYQNLIKVPSSKNESMTFGSATHFALQRLFEKMKKNNKIFPDKEDMLNDFSWYMHRNRESFTRDQFKRRMEYGQKILPAYYDYYINQWNKNVEVERSIRNVEVKGVPINGKLDKIEREANGVNVVDYKTGKFENAKEKLKSPDDKNPHGGDYWRQAVFYKILLDNDRTNDFKVLSSEFDFVEPVKEEYKTAKIEITSADITTVTQQITDTWGKIQNHEFSKGCGKEDCHWCNFVKDNHLQIPLSELMEGEDENNE